MSIASLARYLKFKSLFALIKCSEVLLKALFHLYKQIEKLTDSLPSQSVLPSIWISFLGSEKKLVPATCNRRESLLMECFIKLHYLIIDVVYIETQFLCCTNPSRNGGESVAQKLIYPELKCDLRKSKMEA